MKRKTKGFALYFEKIYGTIKKTRSNDRGIKMKNKSIYYLLALGVGMIGAQNKAEAEETTTYASKQNAPVFYGTKKATIHTDDFFSTKGNGYQKGIYEELEDEDFII